MDYLAEITMAICRSNRRRRPTPATPATSSPSCGRSCPTAWRRGITVIANAGRRQPLGLQGCGGVNGWPRSSPRRARPGRRRPRRRCLRRPRWPPRLRGGTGPPRHRSAAGRGYATGCCRRTSTWARRRSSRALRRGANVVISAAGSPTRPSRSLRWSTSSAGPPTTGTSWPPASSPATSSSAARSAPGGTSPTGTWSSHGRTWASP